jgi:hypothetical protein
MTNEETVRIDRLCDRYLARGEAPPSEYWRWGREYRHVCDRCGTHVGGECGQSIWREVELPDEGLDIICGECF